MNANLRIVMFLGFCWAGSYFGVTTQAAVEPHPHPSIFLRVTQMRKMKSSPVHHVPDQSASLWRQRPHLHRISKLWQIFNANAYRSFRTEVLHAAARDVMSEISIMESHWWQRYLS